LYTVTKRNEVKVTERGSTFLGFLFPCRDETQFTEKLEQVKAKYHDASHYCYAWRVDPTGIRQFSSDDGEPSGTAGLPILNRLKSKELVNIGLIVVRYFGGTKLGKAGLIEAYGGTAEQCLSNIELKKVIPCRWYSIVYNYPEQKVIDRLKQNFNLHEREAQYLEQVRVIFGVAEEKAELFEKELNQIQHLGVSHKELDRGFLIL